MILALVLAAVGPITIDTAAIDRSFLACASDYRRSISGNHTAVARFQCAERAAAAGGDITTTSGIERSYGASAKAGLRWLASLDRQAILDRNSGLSAAMLTELDASGSQYRMALCSMYGRLHGGTIDGSNAALCEARQVDAVIDDRLALLKEAGIIPNGR